MKKKTINFYNEELLKEFIIKNNLYDEIEEIKKVYNEEKFEL
jgi:hypothetical protein